MNDNNTGTQKTEEPRPNPAKNVDLPSLPVKNQYSYDLSNIEKRDAK